MTVWFADASVLLAREDADDDQHAAARRLFSDVAPVATLELAGVSVYDAAYVAGARTAGARLVSCDLRYLVSRDLALTPEQACTAR